ncbi:MAG: response regulator [Huintestinicola sp.]|uniref:response regulator n=1 Tax=Huintestinicola sp. TaxID=2981661 RepID=UPI003F0C5927
MSRGSAEQNKKRIIPGLTFYIAALVFSALLIACTVIWVHDSSEASEQMINLLGEFYLQEITERNAGTINSKIEEKTAQISRAVAELDDGYLKDEETVRDYISLVQDLNGLDIFALADENGMVYTADSTFSGISRFGFLSEEITDTAVYSIKSYGTKTMVAIAIPAGHRETDGIHIVSCFTAVNVESIISAEQLQNKENRIYCRMFDKDGNNLLSINGEYPNGQNLFDIYENKADFAPGFSLQQMKEDWKNGREGYCVYDMADTGNTYVYYKAIPGTDWIITSLMRESNINQVVEAGSRKMVSSSVLMLAVVSVSLAVFLVYIMIAAQKVRRSRSDSEQLKIVGALSNDYSDIFLTDPLRDKVSTIKEHGRMRTAWNSVFRSYSEAWRKYADDYVLPEDAERVLDAVSVENICAKMKDTEEFSIDFRVNYEDRLHYMQAKFVKLFGETDRLIVGIRNIDEQMQAEEERRKTLQDALDAAQHANRAKTVFLNNMSHDIRTPMNAILGYTSLAAAHADNKEQVCDYLKKIQISGSHLLSLINDVLDMSRIESGKFNIEEKEVHLPDVIHDLRSIVQADINSKQLEFYIDTLDVVNEDIICDKLRLNQILLNILSNAVKFTKPGGMVSLRIIQTSDAPNGYAAYEFRVRDNGIGMSEEFRAHIFEAFTRERTSTVSGIQGTGLGMSITKNIVDMMGGTIRVESEVGKGTEFVVDLRFRISKEAKKYEPVPEIKGLRALVADDDADTCMSISSMLHRIGMRSEWTTSGKEAVLRTQFAVSENDEFYAYIIDWLMPDMNGIETVRRIRRIIGDGSPIIILTAYDWSDIEKEAREAGVTKFCSKPVFMSELRDILTEPYRADGKKTDEPAPKTDFSGRKILLVEDNALNQEIAAEILREAGFVIDTADDGENAVEKVKAAETGEYDLILMDIQMPHMDGYEATRRIHALEDPEKANIPIIAMTANAFEEDRQAAFDAGMCGHIAKPINFPLLLEIIGKTLS